MAIATKSDTGKADLPVAGIDREIMVLQERITGLELRVGPHIGFGPGVFFAASIPILYFSRKTYGAGAKQAAQDSWDHPENLNPNAAKDGSAVEYTAKPTKNAEIEITHSDGTKQKHKLVPPGTAPNLGANPPECNKVTITYDKDGHPISVIFS